MASLATIQKAVDREATKLGIATALRVQFAGPSTCKLSKQFAAHAHINKASPNYGMICFARGLDDWRETAKHEAAHFVPGGRHNGLGFLKARASQGDKSAKTTLRHTGHLRCPKHTWYNRYEISRSEQVTAKGLLVTQLVEATCSRCGKHVGS